MKKFFTVVILMVYGLASMGSVLTNHYCLDKQSTNLVKTCKHHQKNKPLDCCSSQQVACSQKTEIDFLETISFKEDSAQPAFPVVFSDQFLDTWASRSSCFSLRKRPSSLHKIRLHLYHRILLI